MSSVLIPYGGIFDVDGKATRFQALQVETTKQGFWDNQELARKVEKERGQLEGLLNNFDVQVKRLEEIEILIELGLEAGDESVHDEVTELLTKTDEELSSMEFLRMMSGEHDSSDAIIEIHSGAGGTDAQDWAEMLFRMYSRWIERSGFSLELVDTQPGEEAGLSRVTLIARGPHAYGWLRAESGVHRLVRISPFDTANRRHTAFAAVYIFPELDDDVDVDIDWEKDIREDRFHASGAGGQHVNKTESAIRLTHLETGLVVSCQSERSQHKNRATARKILGARLYDLRVKQQQEEHSKIGSTKLKIEWGSQIRSYVVHPYRMVKDHRTDVEHGNPDAVFDGDLTKFMEAFLLAQDLKS